MNRAIQKSLNFDGTQTFQLYTKKNFFFTNLAKMYIVLNDGYKNVTVKSFNRWVTHIEQQTEAITIIVLLATESKDFNR